MNINKKALVLLLVSCSLIYGESESQRNIDQSIQVKEQERQRIEQEKKLQELENSQNIINEKKIRQLIQNKSNDVKDCSSLTNTNEKIKT